LTVDAAVGVLANATDVDGDPLAASLVAGPQHGSLTLNADGSFSYTPDAGYQGADQFSYQASDGQADSNVAVVSINVGESVNHPPVAVDDAYSTPQDTPLNVPAGGVLANDTDADGDPLTAALGTAPAHGALTLNADGSFSYVPDAGYAGGDSFTYRANDGTADGNEATVSITVGSAPANTQPHAVNDVYTAPQDTPLSIPAGGVLTNDTDPNSDPLSAVLFKGPQHGTLTLNVDGSFDYAPDSGYSGDDSFTYQASDGQTESRLAAVTIHVEAAPSPAPLLAAELPSSAPIQPDAVDAIFGGNV
jgi:VCBS repeat-containing protein